MSDELLSLLNSHKFLAGVPADDVETIAAAARIIDLQAGVTLFREGEPSEEVYLVEQGNVALEICAPGVGCKRIMTVGDDELLGWSPLLGVSALTATARTIGASRVIAINAEKLLAICDEHPRVGFMFMQRIARALARRLNATRLQLMDVFGSQMTEAEHPTADKEGSD